MRFISTILAAFLAAPLPLAAQVATSGGLEIHKPWTRATPPGARTGGGFVVIRNTGEESDRLTGGSSPVGRVELHTMEISDGVMKMRPLTDGLAIPPGETVELKPGEHHIMFVDLAGAIGQGEPLPVTLVFEKAGAIPIEMFVVPPGAPEPEHDSQKGQ
ncbi:MAG: copper chaperone PCu(A)C [Hyphomicrobiales bacterium]|nr:copper chaperone PCu(A)C [Hyphomicrobiales bacterium]